MRVGLELAGWFNSPRRQYVHVSDSSGFKSRRLVSSERTGGRINPVPDLMGQVQRSRPEAKA